MENAEIILSVQNEVSYLQDKAQIDTQVATAHAFPRDIKRSTNNAIAIATMDKETASTCTYSVPRAGKAITGPSVHLAKIIIQVWGNMRTEAKVISVDDKTLTSQAIAWDLESNVAMKSEVKRSIMTKTGRMSEDMIVVTGNAGNSIALRNAIFSVVPKSVTDKVYREAMQLLTGDISDDTKLIKKRKQVVDGLISAYKVTEDEVLSAIGKASIDHIGKDEIVVLIGIGTAIKDGDTTIDQAFRAKKSGPPVEKTKDETELDRWKSLFNDCKTLTDLMTYGAGEMSNEARELYDAKYKELGGTD